MHTGAIREAAVPEEPVSRLARPHSQGVLLGGAQTLGLPFLLTSGRPGPLHPTFLG